MSRFPHRWLLVPALLALALPLGGAVVQSAELSIAYPYSQNGTPPLLPADFDVAFWLEGAVLADGAVSLRVGEFVELEWSTPDPISVRGLSDGLHELIVRWESFDGERAEARRTVRIDDALYRSVELPGAIDGTTPRPSGADLGYLPRPTQEDIDRAGGRIPPCATHDSESYHALWDPVVNCYHNHEHKDDPSRVDDVFGPVWSWLPERHRDELSAAQSISYPWQTWSGLDSGLPPVPGAYENDQKHAGYGWLVRRPEDYGTEACVSPFSEYCITHQRYQLHALGGLPGARTRNHSFWIEARVCSEVEPDLCGFLRAGGVLDFGELRIDAEVIDLPWNPDNVESNGRRLHGGVEPDSQHASARDFTWYPEHRVASIAVRGTSWGPIDPDHLLQPWFYCIDPTRCRFPNGDMSEAHLTVINGGELEAFDGSEHDLDGTANGRVTLRGYTDRYGEFIDDGACDGAALGIDCVPFQVENLPLAQAQYRDDGHGLPDGIAHYDTSPEGEYWVQFPN